MEVQVAENGWPGIFIPGDEALSMAYMFRQIADHLEKGDIDPSLVAIGLRKKADLLSACYVSSKPPNSLGN